MKNLNNVLLKHSNYKNLLIDFKPSMTLFNIQKRMKFSRKQQDGLTRYEWDLEEPYKRYRFEESRITHGTNAEELISKVPPIEVDDDVALCYGVGEMCWGHPIQFIALNTRDPTKPNHCKYCGLRYIKKQHHHGHH